MDTPRAAAVALGVARANAESTHVLCRHGDEPTPDFMRRVLRRIARIRRHRSVRTLWYVVGEETATSSCAPLLHSLMPLLDKDASVTVVAPASCQIAVFGWLDSIMGRRSEGLAIRAQLYADGEQPLRPRRAQRRALAAASVAGPINTAHARLSLDRFSGEGAAFLGG